MYLIMHLVKLSNTVHSWKFPHYFTPYLNYIYFFSQTCQPPIFPPLEDIFPGNVSDYLTGTTYPLDVKYKRHSSCLHARCVLSEEIGFRI